MESHRQSWSIMSALEDQTRTGYLCDVLFYNDNGSVWAHSCVLAGFSHVFDQLFSLNLKNYHHWSLKQPLQISVNSAIECKSEAISNCFECLAQVVKFVYSGNIKPNAPHLRHLLLLSDRLGNSELIRICEKYREEHSLPGTINGHDQTTLNQGDQERNNFGDSDNVNMTKDEEKQDRTDRLPSLFDCTICNFVCEDLKTFETHKKIFHNSSYKCFYCDRCFKNVPSLLHHVNHECESKSHLVCSVCLYRSLNPTEFSSHLRDHSSPKPFKCSTCKRVFDRRSIWLKHSKSHILNTKYPCNECEREFASSAECAKHVKTVHAPKKHVCEKCGFIAAFPYVLEKHKLKHREERVCDEKTCGFRTSSEAQLVRHKAIHKPKKPTNVDKTKECPVCQIKFTLNKNLKRHMKTHDNDTKSKLKCSLCGYETSRSDKYTYHLEVKHPDRLKISTESNTEHDSNFPADNSTKETVSPIESNSVYSEHVTNSQNSYSMDSPFSKEHNTLLLNDAGDISIVDKNEKNSVTLRNIGNLTGSITLDERTGVLTMNNINSGSVFLNETTGELTYINLENDKNRELNYHFNTDCKTQGDNFKKPAVPKLSSEVIKLDEVTGEIVKVSPSNEDPIAPDADFDSFDMDVNDDSLDGFDDFDEMLFDVFTYQETEGSVTLLHDHSVTNTSLMPHLDESTGLLTFDDNLKNRINEPNETWKSSYIQQNESKGEKEVYKLLLDEVTGVLHND